MELLIFVLILFTIVFVIYLCGHITETLEEIKIVRADLSHYYNAVSERLDNINNRLDELAGEDIESERDFEKELLYIHGYEQYEKYTPAAIDDMAQDDVEAEHGCIYGYKSEGCKYSKPTTCPVEDCKHKQAFLWSLLS